MADYLTTDTELTSIANAIRTRGGTTASLVYPTGFVTAIGNIPGMDVSDTTATAGDVRSSKYFYTSAGVKTQGTLGDGAYSASVSSHSISTTPVVTGSLSGTITNVGTTTKPSGTDGTDYWTITPGGSVTTTGVSSAKGKATIGTAGYIATGNVESSADTKNITPTVNNGTARYLKKATMTVAGTNTVSPTASLSKSNYVYWSNTNNGISITATGGGTASVTATATTNQAGYAPASTQLGSATLNASSNTTTATKYITGIDVPSTKDFAVVALRSETTDSSVLSVENYAKRNVTIYDFEDIPITVTNAIYAVTSVGNTFSGSTVSKSGACGRLFDCVAGEKIAVVGTSVSSYAVHAFIDSSNKIISVRPYTSGIQSYVIPVPENAVKMVVNLSTSGSDVERHGGKITVSAYSSSSTPVKAIETIVTDGVWTTTNVSAAGTYYGKVVVSSASPSFTGGGLSGTATASGSGVSISDSTNNSGVSISTACTATRANVTYNGAVSGFVSKSSGEVALSSGSTAMTAKTYYVNGVTLTAPSSGTRTFSVTVPNGTSTATFTFNVDASGNVTVTES